MLRGRREKSKNRHRRYPAFRCSVWLGMGIGGAWGTLSGANTARKRAAVPKAIRNNPKPNVLAGWWSRETPVRLMQYIIIIMYPKLVVA